MSSELDDSTTIPEFSGFLLAVADLRILPELASTPPSFLAAGLQDSRSLRIPNNGLGPLAHLGSAPLGSGEVLCATLLTAVISYVLSGLPSPSSL